MSQLPSNSQHRFSCPWFHWPKSRRHSHLNICVVSMKSSWTSGTSPKIVFLLLSTHNLYLIRFWYCCYVASFSHCPVSIHMHTHHKHHTHRNIIPPCDIFDTKSTTINLFRWWNIIISVVQEKCNNKSFQLYVTFPSSDNQDHEVYFRKLFCCCHWSSIRMDCVIWKQMYNLNSTYTINLNMVLKYSAYYFTTLFEIEYPKIFIKFSLCQVWYYSSQSLHW